MKISVIVPTSNRSLLLKDTIDSILNQTFNNFELIIIDNNSTDDTEEVLRTYSDSRIRLFKNQKSESVSKNRNLGIKKSRGEYIAFCDDDDYWTSKKLEEINQKIIQSPSVGIIYSDAYLVVEPKFAKNGKSTNYPIRKSKQCTSYLKLLFDNFIICSTVVVKRECFDTCGLFFEEFEAPAGAEDWDMWLRIIKKYRPLHIRKPLIYYRIHSGSSLSNNYEKVNNDILTVIDRNNEKLSETLKNKIYSRGLYVRGRKSLANLEREDARRESYKSIILNPWQYKAYLQMIASFLPIKSLQILKKSRLAILEIYRQKITWRNSGK